MAPKKLSELSKDEQKKFFESFDVVLSDVDGVLFTGIINPIDGSKESIKLLRDLKKKLYFITNNSTAPIDVYLTRLKNLEASKEEVVRPANAVCWYLKKMNFEKEVYVIGMKAFRDELEQAGLNVVYDEISPVDESIAGAVSIVREIRPNVGAVVIDFSLNITYLQLQRSVEYIQKNKAIFLVGAWDSSVPLAKSSFIGAKAFAELIQHATGVVPQVLSKPGAAFQEVIKENVGSFDAKRVLFIGDSIETDMTFASDCGYQKLLVLSGVTSQKDLESWKHEERLRPDYVADSIKDLCIVGNIGQPKL